MAVEMDTEDLMEVQVAPTPVEAKVLVGERLTFNLDQIDKVHADAVVCPQNGTFSGDGSVEKGLLRDAYGNEPFNEAEKLAEDTIHEMNKTGERKSKLPMGFARYAEVPKNNQGVKEIVSVNFESVDEGGPEAAIAAGVTSALREASLYPEKGIKSVAIPLPGGLPIQDSVKAVYAGMQDHFESTPGSTIERVVLVVNGDDNESNRQQLQSILSSVTSSN